MLVVLSVPFYLAKQSQIIAMILVGIVFGPVLHPGDPSPMGLRCAEQTRACPQTRRSPRVCGRQTLTR
jgi:hypothetical protein